MKTYPTITIMVVKSELDELAMHLMAEAALISLQSPPSEDVEFIRTQMPLADYEVKAVLSHLLITEENPKRCNCSERLYYTLTPTHHLQSADLFKRAIMDVLSLYIVERWRAIKQLSPGNYITAKEELHSLALKSDVYVRKPRH